MYTRGNPLHKTTCYATSLMAAMLISTGSQVLAQYSSNASSGQSSVCPRLNVGADRPLRRFTGAQDFMYQTQELKAPVSLSYLPAYRGNGASYRSGIYYPHLKGRQCYVMRYLAKDSPLALLQNFKESLLQNGWQISELQTNSKGLTASRKSNGLYVTLYVYPSPKPEYRSSFELKYLSCGSIQNQGI
jgi:hypothetical protein